MFDFKFSTEDNEKIEGETVAAAAAASSLPPPHSSPIILFKVEEDEKSNEIDYFKKIKKAVAVTESDLIASTSTSNKNSVTAKVSTGTPSKKPSPSESHSSTIPGGTGLVAPVNDMLMKTSKPMPGIVISSPQPG